MDLSLHIGMPAETLARAMTERELYNWQRYAAKKMLPFRRIEMLLAQLAMLIDVRFGGATNKTLYDYLFEPEPDEGSADDLDEAVEFFDFKPKAHKS